MILQFVLGLVRHCLTFGGGVLAAQGWGSASDWDGIIGSIITILGIGWSIYDKHKTQKAVGVAGALAEAVGGKK